MAANQKLTSVLRGRTATRIEALVAMTVLHFADGSTMTVQTAADAPTPPAAATLGQVRGVRQKDTSLDIDFDTGSTLSRRTAEATASVIVRAKDHSLEYAD